MVYYHCKYCKQEIGSLPMSSARWAIAFIRKMDEATMESKFLTYEANGNVTLHVICEQCELTLAQNPHYYLLDHWLQ